MAKLALFDSSDRVENAIVGDPADYPNAKAKAKDITGTQVGPGWQWDEANSQWIAPTPTPLPITPTALLDLLKSAGGVTHAELVSIRDDAAMQPFWIMLQLASQIEKESPNLQSGLDALVAAGYLTSAERDAVEAAWPSK